MRRLRIGPRLTLSFAAIVVLVFVGSAVSVWQLNVMQEQARYLHHIDTEIETILRVHNSLLILQDRLHHVIAAGERDTLDREIGPLETELMSDLDEAIHTLRTSPVQANHPDYTDYIAQLEATQTALTRNIDSIRRLTQENEWPAATLRLENLIDRENRRMQALADEISETIAAEQAQALDRMVQAQRQTLTATAVTGTLILLLAGLLGFAVTRSITFPLHHLDMGAKALARRQFDHRVPINGRDELTQVSHLFNDTAQQLAKLYTDLEALVGQRTQALQANTEELHHRYLQLETCIAVGQRATSILDINILLNEVVELIRERFGYYYVGVFLLDKDDEVDEDKDDEDDYVIARAGTGQAGQRLCQRGFRLKVGQEGVVGWVAQHRRALRIDDVLEEKRYIRIEEIPDSQSECALPLAMGHRVIGVLDIHSRHRRAFRMEDMPVLQSLADQVAIAIHNATLYQSEKNRRQLAETLYHVGRALSRTLDLPEVLDLILEHLATIVPYDQAAVLLKDHDELEFVAVRGFPEDVLKLRVFIGDNDEDVFRQIYQTEQPLIVSDVSRVKNWQHIPGLSRVRSWLSIPLIRFDSVIGMLSLTRAEAQAYSEDQGRLATTFAGQAAIALENARLYDKITRFTQQLEDMVRERTDALREAYIQLEHLDQTKSDFINIAAHELRTPLTVLRGYAQILLGDKAIQANERHQEMIGSIHSGSVRLHEVVNSMLDMTKIDGRALTLYPEPLSIQPLIEVVCQEFQEPLRAREQTLRIERLQDLPTIEADPEALHKVFYHLISNAIKYTPDRGRITISGQAVTETETGRPGVEIIIADTGIGINPDFHELIFKKFYQTGELALHSSSKTNFKGAGPGLGLAIARGIAEAHKGKLWAESKGYDEERYPGSQFHLMLPLRQSRGAAEVAAQEKLSIGG